MERWKPGTNQQLPFKYFSKLCLIFKLFSKASQVQMTLVKEYKREWVNNALLAPRTYSMRFHHFITGQNMCMFLFRGAWDMLHIFLIEHVLVLKLSQNTRLSSPDKVELYPLFHACIQIWEKEGVVLQCWRNSRGICTYHNTPSILNSTLCRQTFRLLSCLCLDNTRFEEICKFHERIHRFHCIIIPFHISSLIKGKHSKKS